MQQIHYSVYVPW